MEQSARALNGMCAQWLERRRGHSLGEHISLRERYHQARNEAATRSRKARPQLSIEEMVKRRAAKKRHAQRTRQRRGRKPRARAG